MIDRYSLEWLWRDYIDVSHGFAEILDKLLANKPKDRYQSAQDVLTALVPTSPAVTVVSQTPRGNAPQLLEKTQPEEQRNSLDPAFIDLCQKELANCIGPIAGFLIEETLNQNPAISAPALIEAIVAKIPNFQQAIAFRRRLF